VRFFLCFLFFLAQCQGLGLTPAPDIELFRFLAGRRHG
jgi:hypothetical protein